MIDPNPASGSQRPNRRFSFARFARRYGPLIAIVVFGLGFRLIDLNRGLWLDELHTSWTVADTLTEMGARAEAGNQAPLYFYLVKTAVSAFGHTEWSLRLISVLSGLAIIVAGYFIVLRLSDSEVAAMLSAWLVAVDPFFVEYSQEARPYALLQLVGMGQLGLFVLRVRQQSGLENSTPKQVAWTRALFVFSVAASFYIHFTSALLTASLFFGIVIWNTLKGLPWTRTRTSLLVDFVIALLLCLPAANSIFSIASRKGNWELFVNDSFWTPVLIHHFWIYLLGGVIALICFSGRLCKEDFRFSANSIWILFVAFLGPVLLSWVSFKTGTAALYHHRYFLIGWAGSILFATTLIGFGFNHCGRIGRFVSSIVGLYLFAASLGFNSMLWNCIQKGEMPFASPWNDAVETVNGLASEKDLIYLFPNLIEDRQLVGSGEEAGQDEQSNRSLLKQYCLFPINGIYQCEMIQQHAKPTLLRPRFGKSDIDLIKENGDVFLLIRGDAGIVGDINNEFAEFGIRNQLFIQLVDSRQFEFRGVAGHFIALFRFKVTVEQGPKQIAVQR